MKRAYRGRPLISTQRFDIEAATWNEGSRQRREINHEEETEGFSPRAGKKRVPVRPGLTSISAFPMISSISMS
jgi:hypothetical protein